MEYDTKHIAKLFQAVLLIALLLSSVACLSPQSVVEASDDINKTPENSKPAVDLAKDATAVKTPIRYKTFPVRGAGSVAELRSKLGEQGLQLVLKLNRVDLDHVRRGGMLLVPETESDLLAVSPFPAELEAADSVGKLILVSRRVQAFGVYQSGKLVYWGPTSTGKKATETPAGLYHTNWRKKLTHSTVNSSWVLPWCFNLDNFEGISFHQYDLPGYPASHGCVRLLEEDAKWIYEWADQWVLSKSDRSLLAHGTPVIIFGDYRYGQTAPWKKLADDPDAASLSPTEIEEALSKHLPVIEARAQSRTTIITALSQTGPNQ
jgi:lipoprotein-anchoring transpeptidase ErfK/SrfK